MRYLRFALIFLATLAFGQDVYLPIGNTRQLQLTKLILVAPGILAEPDTVKGQSAYDACVATNSGTPNITCESARASIMATDAAERFVDAFKKLYKGASNPDLVLATDRLYVVQ